MPDLLGVSERKPGVGTNQRSEGALPRKGSAKGSSIPKDMRMCSTGEYCFHDPGRLLRQRHGTALSLSYEEERPLGWPP